MTNIPTYKKIFNIFALLTIDTKQNYDRLIAWFQFNAAVNIKSRHYLLSAYLFGNFVFSSLESSLLTDRFFVFYSDLDNSSVQCVRVFPSGTDRTGLHIVTRQSHNQNNCPVPSIQRQNTFHLACNNWQLSLSGLGH